MKIKNSLFLTTISIGCFLTMMDVHAKSKTCPVGEFVMSTKCRDCPPGCFCSGGGTETMSLDHKNEIDLDEVKNFCLRKRSSCSHQGKDGYGVCGRQDHAKLYLCPSIFPNSDGNVSSKNQCFAWSGGQKVYYGKKTCVAGEYLPKNSPKCVECKSGSLDYCPGIKDAEPSTTADQGLSSCSGGKVANASHTDCAFTDVQCIAGTYLPANSISCAPCKNRYYYCPGGTFGKQPINQGIFECRGNGQSVNETKTACIQGEITIDQGYYLPANTNKQKKCTDEKHYCPGGSFDKKSQDQGRFECPGNSSAKSDKSACVMKISKDDMSKCYLSTEDINDTKYKNCVMGAVNLPIVAESKQIAGEQLIKKLAQENKPSADALKKFDAILEKNSLNKANSKLLESSSNIKNTLSKKSALK